MRLDQNVVWIVRVPYEPRVLSDSSELLRAKALGDWTRCRSPFRWSAVGDLDPSLPGSVYNRCVVGVDQ